MREISVIVKRMKIFDIVVLKYLRPGYSVRHCKQFPDILSILVDLEDSSDFLGVFIMHLLLS